MRGRFDLKTKQKIIFAPVSLAYQMRMHQLLVALFDDVCVHNLAIKRRNARPQIDFIDHMRRRRQVDSNLQTFKNLQRVSRFEKTHILTSFVINFDDKFDCRRRQFEFATKRNFIVQNRQQRRR